MSSKIEIATVADVLKKHKLEPALLREVIEELNEQAQPEEDKEVAPRVKTQFVVWSAEDSHQAWVFQVPETASPHTITERIDKAAHAFNASKKGRLLPVKNRSEAIESVPRRFWKDADGTVVKTKIGVALIEAVNKLSEPLSV